MCQKYFKVQFVIRSTLKKRLMLEAVEKDKGAKASSSKKVTYGENEIRGYLVLPPFPCGGNLEPRIKDHVIHMPKVEFLPFCRRKLVP